MAEDKISEEELWERISSKIDEFKKQDFLEVYGDLKEDADSIIAHRDFDSIRSRITKQNYKDFFSKWLNFYGRGVEILSLYDLYMEYFPGYAQRIGMGELEVFISNLRENKEKLNTIIDILNGQ